VTFRNMLFFMCLVVHIIIILYPQHDVPVMLRRQNSAAMFLTHGSPASLLDGSGRRIRIE
jgi:hypothetical protein